MMPGLLAHVEATLADRYAIERELGSGGMATVYLAEDLKHDRQVMGGSLECAEEGHVVERSIEEYAELLGRMVQVLPNGALLDCRQAFGKRELKPPNAARSQRGYLPHGHSLSQESPDGPAQPWLAPGLP